MGARHKLNRAFFNGSLVLAGAIGYWADSWLLFGLALLALLAWNLHEGDIRPKRTAGHRK
jgi:hypothetical protein